MTFFDRIVCGASKQRPLLSRLRQSDCPVIIFGAGVYAYVLYQYLAANGIAVVAAMVDAAHKSEDTFMGLKVLTTDETVGRLADYRVVVGTTHYPAAIEKLTKLGASEVFVIDVPDFLNIPNAFMDVDFVRANRDLFYAAYGLFSDDLSRDTYVAAINTKLEEDLSYIRPHVRLDHLYFGETEFPLNEHEVLLDVGGFSGDSVREFHAITKGQYARIISLEPFANSFERLRTMIATLGLSKVVPLQIGAWDKKTVLSFETKEMNIDNRIVAGGSQRIEVDTIDTILSGLGSAITLIKMDINGAEYRALSGARETIRRYRPRIAVKMHVKEDFFRLPILLKEVAPDIKLYLRQRNFMSMMLVLYGVFDRGQPRHSPAALHGPVRDL
jgi:FkbM family methyltransferase